MEEDVPLHLVLVTVSSALFESDALGVYRLYSSARKHIPSRLVHTTVGAPLDGVLAEIPEGTSIVGIDVYDNTMDYVQRLSDRIKECFPSAVIVYGSKFATMHYLDILEDTKSVDYVILGYGEEPLRHICNMVRANRREAIEDYPHVASRTSRKDKTPTWAEETVNSPFRDERVYRTRAIAGVLVNESCIGNCTFCGSNLHQEWHIPSTRSTVEEIVRLHREYGVSCFMFYDNSLEDPGDEGKERLWALCHQILALEIPLSFYAPIKAHTFTPEDMGLLDHMKAAGFQSLFVGIDAGNTPDLVLYNKMATLEANRTVLGLLDAARIDRSLFGFVMLNPFSTERSVAENVTFLNEAGTWIFSRYLTRVHLFKATPLFRKAAEANLLSATYSYKRPTDYSFADPFVRRINRSFESIRRHPVCRKMAEFAMLQFHYVMQAGVHEELRQHESSFRQRMTRLANASSHFFALAAKDPDVVDSPHGRDFLGTVDDTLNIDGLKKRFLTHLAQLQK